MAPVRTAIPNGTGPQRRGFGTDSESRASRASHVDLQLPRPGAQQRSGTQSPRGVALGRVEENRASCVSRGMLSILEAGPTRIWLRIDDGRLIAVRFKGSS